MWGWPGHWAPTGSSITPWGISPATARTTTWCSTRQARARSAGAKRLLKLGGIYMSTGPGPWYQNLILPLATPLLGGKKVVFAYPRIDQETVMHFAHLLETGQFTPVIDRRV